MNLMNSDHKATNDKYRMGYDGIRWESKCRPPAWATTKELRGDYKADIEQFKQDWRPTYGRIQDSNSEVTDEPIGSGE